MSVIIVGAGLAGLSCGIELLQAGYDVTILDKGQVPSLKVCGEYLSLEALPILEQLGVALGYSQHPLIDTLVAQAGKATSRQMLPLGGLGISRQLLDGRLKDRFEALGGKLLQYAPAKAITSQTVTLKDGQSLSAARVVNATGRQNPFAEHARGSGLYVGYKKQIPLPPGWPVSQIYLSFHRWGYFGINAIEGSRLCICTLANQEAFRQSGSIQNHINAIQGLEPEIRALIKEPAPSVAVSNFSFYDYEPANLPQIGDAGRNIPPLVGNGMALALRSGIEMGKSLATHRAPNLHKENFRIGFGIALNKLAQGPAAGLSLWAMENLPQLGQRSIAQTHGVPERLA